MWAISSCAATCCAYCACEACKGAVGSIGRRSARIAYVVLFALVLLLAWAVRDFSEPIMRYVSWLDTLHVLAVPSEEWLKTQGVLRVTAAAFMFFSLMALLLLHVDDESDYRDEWHHGGWMMKLLLLLVLLVVSFMLPDTVVDAYAASAWLGSAFFLFVQIVLLLDFTYEWNDAWASKDDDNWYTAMLVVSIACYVVAVAGLVTLFLWFSPAGHDCSFNNAVLFFAFLLVVAFTATALHEEVNGSLLPSSVVALYCVYLTGAALSSEPTAYECNGMAQHNKALSGGRLAMSIVFTLASIAYSALRAGSNSASALGSGGNDEPLLPLNGSASRGGGDRDDHDSSSGDRSGPVAYNYTFFHLVFAAAAMYSGMLLTGWGSSQAEGAGVEKVLDVGWGSVGVKAAQALVTALLYTWSLVAPLVLPDRDFM